MIILVITAVIIASTVIIRNRFNSNVISGSQNSQEYSGFSDNCECLAHGRPYCLEGFVMKGNLCFNSREKTYTTEISGCSEYNCSGEIKIWNNATKIWENKTGGLA